MKRRILDICDGGILRSFLATGALLCLAPGATSAQLLCNHDTYVQWEGVACPSGTLESQQPCCTRDYYYCANGQLAYHDPILPLVWGPCGDMATWPQGPSTCGASLGQPQSCGQGKDDDFDGCIDEGCTLGSGHCTCTAQCDHPSCTNKQVAWCNPYNGLAEVCGDGIDNNCNGRVDEGCKPPTGPNKCGVTAGDDPILLATQSAVTEPFTDFSVDTGLLQLGLTRVYTSNDWSYSGGPTGTFGRGWHHDWEGWLSCGAGSCTAALGADGAYQFQPGVPATALSLDGTETWQIYTPGSNGITIVDHQNILVRRPGGEWIMFSPDGREFHFDVACDACSAGDVYCQDAATGGKARLVKVVDPKGNAVRLAYDRPGGMLLGLADDLGHSLQLLSPTACTNGFASSLRYDGTTVATYSYGGSDLVQAMDGDGHVLRSYAYDTVGTQRLLAVKNESGDAVASFSYDGMARSTGVIDKRSSVAVGYSTPGSPQVTEFYGSTSSTSVRTLDADGHATSISDGCACGPPRTLQWTNRRLTCSSDALGHVARQEFDTQGRLTSRAEFSSSLGCSASSGTLDSGQSRVETRTYGITRAIAQGVSLALDNPTLIRMGRQESIGGDYELWGSDHTFTYDPTPQSSDPAGYTCQETPLPAGSVVCRESTSALTHTAAGSMVYERHTTYFSYDTRGRLIKTLGPINTSAPSPSDVIPLEVRTYWADTDTLARRGRLHQVMRYPSPTGAPLVTTFDYDFFGPYQVTQPNGAITTIVKDGRGRPVAVLAPDGGLRTTRYHDGLDPSVQVLPSGAAVRSKYDALGRLASVEYFSGDPDAAGAPPTLGWAEHHSYDAAGNRVHTERRDGAGLVTWQQDRQYDVQHRLVSETNPAAPGTSKTYTYDGSGFLTATTDESGRVTKYTPDGISRVNRVTRTDASGTSSLDVAQYVRQAYGDSLSQVIDGNGQTTSYLYDYFDRLMSLNSNNLKGGKLTFIHDARGNLLQRNDTYAKVKYTYDGLDRVLTVNATNAVDGSSIAYTFRYDETPYPGQLTTVIEPDRTVRYAYDAMGRRTSETIQENGVTSALVTEYVYSTDGLLTDITYPSGLHVRLVRDPATREVVQVDNVADGTHYASQVSHLPGGPVKSLVFGNGLTLSQTFDLRYQPQTIASGPLSLSYGMTADGDVGTIVEGPTARTFSYDFLDRLVSSPGWLSYNYDNNGNRTSETVAGANGVYTYVYDQLAGKSAGGKSRYGYASDYQGNLSGVALYTSAGTKLASGMCLRHDALGRMVLAGNVPPKLLSPSYFNGGIFCTVDSQATATAQFKYDARGRRIARWLATTKQWTYIVSDAAGNPLSEVIKPASGTGPWTKVRDYVWLDGKPLAQVEYPGPTGSTQGYVYYYHLDHIGLPRNLTNASRTTVWSAAARPYGDITETTTTDPLSGRTIVTNLRLPGQYDERLLGSLGLQGPYYNWNRWYLPGVGRYLELDPIAADGGFNESQGPVWYAYARANPLVAFDSTGSLGEPPPRHGEPLCEYGVCVPSGPPDTRSCETKCTDEEANCRAFWTGVTIVGQGTCRVVCTSVLRGGPVLCTAICSPPPYIIRRATNDSCFKTWLDCMGRCKKPQCDKEKQ